MLGRETTHPFHGGHRRHDQDEGTGGTIRADTGVCPYDSKFLPPVVTRLVTCMQRFRADTGVCPYDSKFLPPWLPPCFRACNGSGQTQPAIAFKFPVM